MGRRNTEYHHIANASPLCVSMEDQDKQKEVETDKGNRK